MIAQTLGARDGLAGHIGDREMLLLLDNLEQVIEAAPDLSALLSVCPNLALLVTSRELLRVQGEVEYSVPPLASSEAISLFCERSGLDATAEVGELCARLDDLPLAVELAAARTRALSLAQILQRLSRRLDLLQGGRDAEARQKTLRATIEWSYDLLADEEKPHFARLAVFRGGCTLDAAEDVVGASLDAMQSLVDKSLLRHAEERFWMLETIREFAAELQADADSLRQRHADYFLRLAEEAEPHLTGSQQAPWLERLEAEHDNFRLSLDSLRHADRGDEWLRLVGALMRFWYVRGHAREGSSRCEDALAATDDQSQPRLKALFGAGLLAHRLGNYQRAGELMQERLELARRVGDAEAVASSLNGLGLTAHGLGDHERAAEAFTEAADLARAGGYTWFLAVATGNLGEIAREQGDFAQARARLEESLALFLQLGDERKIVEIRVHLGIVASREGGTDEAKTLLHESLEYAQARFDKELAIWCLGELATLALSEGNAGRAGRLTGAMERLRQETGYVAQGDERRMNEQTRNDLTSELGEEHFAAAHSVGRKMAFEQAMAYALQN